MVMQREYTRFYSGSDKEGPTSSGGGEFCISLHLSACVGVTSCERGMRPHVSRRGKKSILLEMLILEAGECLVVFVVRCSSSVVRCPLSVVPLGRSPAFLFIGSSEGKGVDKSLGGALKAKVRRTLWRLL
jgi:hypothetical protein